MNDSPLSTMQRLGRWPRRSLMALVQAYRVAISPALGPSCRFEPSCSAFALEALERHGAAAGTYLAARRVLRCGPWCEGGHDPVPADPPDFFRGHALEASPSSHSTPPSPP